MSPKGEVSVSRTGKEAIRESLATVRAEVPGAEGGSVPLRLRADTLRFVKKRGSPTRQLWYVTCDGEGGPKGRTRWHWTVLACQDEPGRWSAQGVAGGSGDPPVRGRAWANLGGNWGPGGFSAGGTVEDSGQGVVRVRLTDAEGRTFEDTVDDRVVLFMSQEPVAMPMRVELYDADGRAVATEEWGFSDG
jgi:hypothetical protein